MMFEHSSLDKLRHSGILAIVIGAWISTAVLAITGWALGRDDVAFIVFLAALGNVAPTLIAVRHATDPSSRLVVGTLAALHPAMFVFLLQGQPWQMDLHMYFFVALAVLTVMCDWRPIVLASALIALHHLLLDYLEPAWVFSGVGNFGRVMVHAVMVILQCGALAVLTKRLTGLIQSQEAARVASEASAHAADRAAEEAMSARLEAEESARAMRVAELDAASQREARENAEKRVAEAKRQSIAELASSFEKSVLAVVDAVSAAAEQLAGSARNLSDYASETGDQVVEIAAVASQANAEAREVASAVLTFGGSISEIASSVSRQASLTEAANEQGSKSDQSVQLLGARVHEIEGFITKIESVARRTNLLALNAAIEAARAGHSGRGFAVVASEIKQLAGQVTGATAEIAMLISGVQSGTVEAESSIRDVVTGIRSVSDAAATIANAITEQRRAADMIGINAERSAAGTGNVHQQMEQILSNARAAGAQSSDVQRAATDLAERALQLRAATGSFMSQVLAA